MTTPTDTRPCKCGKKMIKRYTGMVLMSNPPRYSFDWWCGCGNTEVGGSDAPQMESEDERYRKIWESVQ